ncbi:uncharacterized protein [Diadema setosum]|uniref:uncharacterized protein n=1 Tax=Diadema setosum TaxID=31175 RepID=UPI003B3ACB6F
MAATVRSSTRLKSRKSFQMPSRDDVLDQIEADRTPHKGFSQLRPRKLIHDLVKGHNRYNNLDPISLYDDDAMSDFIDDGNEDDSRDEEENDSSTSEDDDSGNDETSGNENSDDDDDDSTSDEVEIVYKLHIRYSQRKSKVRRKKRSFQLISDEESDKDNNNNDSSSKLQTCPRKRGGRKKMKEITRHDKSSAVRQHGEEKPDVEWDVEELGISESTKLRRRKRRATLESSDDDTPQEDEDEDQKIGMRCGGKKRRRTICSSDEDT